MQSDVEGGGDGGPQVPPASLLVPVLLGRAGRGEGSGQSWAGKPQSLVSFSALRLAWKREQGVEGGGLP